jgi:hypothetical protein
MSPVKLLYVILKSPIVIIRILFNLDLQITAGGIMGDILVRILQNDMRLTLEEGNMQ